MMTKIVEWVRRRAFRRPGTRYILTRIAIDGSDDGLAECATLADIYGGLARWFPGRNTYVASLSTTEVLFFSYEGDVIARLREVFE